MKFKLIILFLFPLFLSAQNNVFESVFQTIVTKDTIEVCHVKIQVNIKNDNIKIYSINGEVKTLIFDFTVEMQTSDDNFYWYADESSVSYSYVKEEEQLFIRNSAKQWIIYGKIPSVIKFNK